MILSIPAYFVQCPENEVLEVLKRTVRPEFLNRIDEVIMFEPLSQSDIRDILRMQMNAKARAYIHLNSNLDSLDPQILSPVNIYQHRDLDL